VNKPYLYECRSCFWTFALDHLIGDTRDAANRCQAPEWHRLPACVTARASYIGKADLRVPVGSGIESRLNHALARLEWQGDMLASLTGEAPGRYRFACRSCGEHGPIEKYGRAATRYTIHNPNHGRRLITVDPGYSPVGRR